LLAARGITVSHQTVRLWADKFGRHFANDLRKRSVGRLGDKWHLDVVVINIWERARATRKGQPIQARAAFFTERFSRFFINDRKNSTHNAVHLTHNTIRIDCNAMQVYR